LSAWESRTRGGPGSGTWYCRVNYFEALTGQSPCRSIRQGDRLGSLLAQMQIPNGHSGGRPPQPGPPRPANCACWTTPGVACGVVAALATPLSPIAEKPSAPAMPTMPTIFFRVMVISFLLVFTHAAQSGWWVDKRIRHGPCKTLRCSSQRCLPPRDRGLC